VAQTATTSNLLRHLFLKEVGLRVTEVQRDANNKLGSNLSRPQDVATTPDIGGRFVKDEEIMKMDRTILFS
jgi:hypothetical protein